MKAPSEDLKDQLVTDGVGVFATDIFIGLMPGLPDANVTLRDTTGPPPELRYELEEPGVQVIVRAAKGGYLTAEAKAKEVQASLHGLNNVVLNGTRYLIIAAAHSPFFVGGDELNRPMFTINFEIKRTTAAT